MKLGPFNRSLKYNVGMEALSLEFIVRIVYWLVSHCNGANHFSNVTWNKATLFEIDVSSINCSSILDVQDGVTLRGKDLFILLV